MDHPVSAVARAHANIGLVKYWGKLDHQLNLPAVSSISAGLSGLFTETSIRFGPELLADELTWDGQKAPEQPTRRVSRFLDLVRERAGTDWAALVETTSNIPRDVGLASSAAAFASLTLAACAALGLDLDPAALSALARRGSGSAARSLFGGYVELPAGGDDGRHAVEIAAATHLPLGVALVLASPRAKPVSSGEGMIRSARTSPFYPAWVASQPADLERVRQAILLRDFEQLADTAQQNCLKMHAVAMTSLPAIIYPDATTWRCIELVLAMRRDGLDAFFTVDAGASVAMFFSPSCRQAVVDRLAEIDAPVHLTDVGGPPVLVETR